MIRMSGPLLAAVLAAGPVFAEPGRSGAPTAEAPSQPVPRTDPPRAGADGTAISSSLGRTSHAIMMPWKEGAGVAPRPAARPRIRPAAPPPPRPAAKPPA